MKLTSQKIFFLIVFLLLAGFTGFFIWPKNNQILVSPTSLNNQQTLQSPTPKPSPSPLLNITDKSNLSDEINKLKVPEFSDDYQKLDQSLSGF